MIIDYKILVVVVLLLWISSALFKSRLLGFIGSLVIAGFLTYLWITLGRPPLKSLGETRLWYALFLPLLGLIVDYKLKKNWISLYAMAMSSLFLIINFLNPESFNEELVPALQSIWFIPHVIVYMLAYALLGLVTLFALKALFKKDEMDENLSLIDSLLNLGLSFLTFGLLFGAIWAKEAWGHYWSWDPKETWAFITWAIYLGYLHYRHSAARSDLFSVNYLLVSFVVLMLAWFGVNYMPAAKSSVHTYAIPETVKN